MSDMVYKNSLLKRIRTSTTILLSMVTFFLSGCHSGALAPKGQIAADELKLIIFSAEIMLLVVIPVILMSLWFGWRYREKNNAKYKPEWTHSTILEIFWWTIPILIIVVLGTVTWKTTHSLDPYKPIHSPVKPVVVEVVSLDWKWLFIYPDYKIATINYLHLPVNTPIDFKITAASPMNSFIIPQLGGQIYAMTGMLTQLHLIANETGIYRGLATNYTGAGFSGMHFNTDVTSPEEFAKWVEKTQKTSGKLTKSDFWKKLMKKSINNPVVYFSDVEEGLFENIIRHYMMPSPHAAHHQ